MIFFWLALHGTWQNFRPGICPFAARVTKPVTFGLGAIPCALPVNFPIAIRLSWRIFAEHLGNDNAPSIPAGVQLRVRSSVLAWVRVDAGTQDNALIYVVNLLFL
jgi:hypothetical protein